MPACACHPAKYLLMRQQATSGDDHNDILLLMPGPNGHGRSARELIRLSRETIQLVELAKGGDVFDSSMDETT